MKINNALSSKHILLFLTFSFLNACATSTTIYTSDGKVGHSIVCSGSALNWGMCYEKAGRLCGSKGYNILEKSGDQGGMVSGNQFGLYGGSIINRNMIIQCKE